MGTQVPRISVVIPAYNQASFLTSALQSVFRQTYRDFEVIVVDDGSTDSTPEIAQQFSHAIRYVRQPNQGLAGARNTGIRHAHGEYVALLDCDDEWLPDFLGHMMLLTKQYPEASVYYCGVQYMSAEGHLLPQKAGRVVAPDLVYHTLLRGNFLFANAILMRRVVAMEAGLFDPSFRRLEDREFWLRLAKQGHRFAGSTAHLARYRLHGASLSADPTKMQEASMAVTEKHFGPDDGEWHSWSEEKRRAYGGNYRYHALTSLFRQQDWQASSNYLRLALQIDPSLAFDLGLFYEFALGTQPLGYRGTVHHLDLQTNLLQVRNLLSNIFQTTDAKGLQTVRRQVYGTAYLALGLVAFHASQLHLCRRLLLTALYFRPDLVRNRQVLSSLMKSLLGQTGLGYLRRWRNTLLQLRLESGAKHNTL